jgi:hypothetical protein
MVWRITFEQNLRLRNGTDVPPLNQSFLTRSWHSLRKLKLIWSNFKFYVLYLYMNIIYLYLAGTVDWLTNRCPWEQSSSAVDPPDAPPFAALFFVCSLREFGDSFSISFFQQQQIRFSLRRAQSSFHNCFRDVSFCNVWLCFLPTLLLLTSSLLVVAVY